ncbi:hypothetical protein KL86DES1_20462 [uncultured Desulfovibrio sp.]|uniref:Uncharacterized protein n=1 Tax=uncultured Desulfovibrio sp. TaxID=167968 RepID=A0A212L415_9BACT|nr:hypothetical protein KL86DES1_20462 [uncultured Desulfovibrio sp.]VZH33364.1 conserved protein of unknown function [Desulfovibrio sp. 86]
MVFALARPPGMAPGQISLERDSMAYMDAFQGAVAVALSVPTRAAAAGAVGTAAGLRRRCHAAAFPLPIKKFVVPY